MNKRHKTFHQSDVVSDSPSQQMRNYTLELSSLTKTQIRELRKSLLSELNQVRSMINRIESVHFGNVASFNSQNVINRSGLGLGLGLVETHWTVLLKECGKILSKLLKDKFAYIFNVPVDAIAMNLLDYHTIVMRPMDLGTVKANLGKKVYSTPLEFAADVRLTFENAMLYNPKENAVHGMAEGMLARFEKLFKPIQQKIDVLVSRRGMEMNVQESGTIKNATPEFQLLPEVIKRTPFPVVNQQQLPMYPPVMESKGAVKQPKPRAKDQNKRDMSSDEKLKLEVGLQSIPEENMPKLLKIMRKRNERFGEDGGEIEVDLETLDTETLWELDRFVKKLLRKKKRQSLSVNNNPTSGGADPSMTVTETDMDNDEEDVDIGDDMPPTNFPTVQIEKDVVDVGEEHAQGQDQKDNGSSSSSGSSSDSSSSSDSDSGSDTVAPEAQS